MIMIVLSIIVLLILQGVVIKFCSNNGYGFQWWEAIFGSAMMWLLGGMIAFIICLITIPYTGGLYRGYSHGTRDGYITKLADNKGIIFKTYEGEMQIGVGEQASLQVPWEWSIAKDKTNLMAIATELRGKKVRIEYVQWLMMDARVGKSDYEVINIEEIKETR